MRRQPLSGPAAGWVRLTLVRFCHPGLLLQCPASSGPDPRAGLCRQGLRMQALALGRKDRARPPGMVEIDDSKPVRRKT